MSSSTQPFPKPKRTNTGTSEETMISRESYPASQASKDTGRNQSSGPSDFERLSYGRHSSDWLFNGFSVRQTVKNAISKKKDSSK